MDMVDGDKGFIYLSTIYTCTQHSCDPPNRRRPEELWEVNPAAECSRGSYVSFETSLTGNVNRPVQITPSLRLLPACESRKYEAEQAPGVNETVILQYVTQPWWAVIWKWKV